MKRRFKAKKSFNFKKILILLIPILLIYLVCNNVSLKDKILSIVVNEINKKENIISIDITNPKNVLYSSLNKIIYKDSLIKSDDYFDYDNSETTYVEDINTKKVDDPIVYIYNSHQLESYNKDILYDYSIKPNVLIASYILKEKLNEKGIPSIVETNDIKKYLNDNKLQYNKSYVASRYYINQMLEKEKSIKYLIDIHRDSASYNVTHYKYENKDYARIMFVVGLDHKDYKHNLELANKLNDMLNKKYPGFSRGISKKTGSGVNGIYNQDISHNSMLIEVGGVDNKIEEVNNTMDILSDLLSEYIKEN